jgi:hypothetical protein
MGSTLFSAAYAAQAAEIRRDLLDSWLKTGQFETEHYAQNSKTREKTFYFAQSDVNRLAEFAARETRQARPSEPQRIETSRGA